MAKTAVQEGPAQQVVVTGTPVGANEPTEQGKALTERMNALDEIKAEASNTLADRLADSGLGYYDDNGANRRYITKLNPSELHTALGTPAYQIRKIPFPTDDANHFGALEGVHVMREDGTFYSIPAGVRSLGDVFDPESKEPLVGKVDPKKAKARAAAASAPEKAGEPKKK